MSQAMSLSSTAVWAREMPGHRQMSLRRMSSRQAKSRQVRPGPTRSKSNLSGNEPRMPVRTADHGQLEEAEVCLTPYICGATMEKCLNTGARGDVWKRPVVRVMNEYGQRHTIHWDQAGHAGSINGAEGA